LKPCELLGYTNNPICFLGQVFFRIIYRRFYYVLFKYVIPPAVIEPIELIGIDNHLW